MKRKILQKPTSLLLAIIFIVQIVTVNITATTINDLSSADKDSTTLEISPTAFERDNIDQAKITVI